MRHPVIPVLSLLVCSIAAADPSWQTQVDISTMANGTLDAVVKRSDAG